MKKLFKSKIFWGILIVILIVIAFIIRSASSGKQTTYTTEAAKIGNLTQTVSATGQVKSASTIDLNFKNPGQLAVLKVDTGAQVKAGDFLAQQKATDLAIAVSQAQADYQEAKANLDKIVAGSTVQEIDVAKAAVQKAETDLANAKSTLENYKITYAQNIENAKQDLLSYINIGLTKSKIALQAVLDTTDYQGDPGNFVTSNYSLNTKVDNEYFDAKSLVDTATISYQAASVNSSDDLVSQATSDAVSAITSTKNNLDDLGELLDYTITNSTITQSVLDTLKTSINTQRNTTDTSLSNVFTYKQNLADARVTYQTKIDDAQNSIAVAEKNLTSAQASLDLKTAPARSEDVSTYQARLQRAAAALALAQDRYNDTIIRAPIDGVITEVNYEIGEQTSATKPAISMLATQNYEVEVDIPESDIAKVVVSDPVTMTLDAFTQDQVFDGMVTKINPAQTEIQDVVYYKVTVVFSSTQQTEIQPLLEAIKPGMTANVDIKTAEKNNVLLVPSRAVKDNNGAKTVQILQSDNKVQNVTVTTGIKGDDGLIEITSGLQAGQNVITYTSTK